MSKNTVNYILFTVLCVLFAMWAFFVASKPDTEKEIKIDKKEEISFTRKELMTIYENGYLSGVLNHLKNKDKYKNHNSDWFVDSTRVSDMFFGKK